MESGKREKIIPLKDDILDQLYYPSDQKICTVPRTTTIPKRDVVATFKPHPKSQIKYTISQTEAKLDAGATKIHYTETKAYYKHPPVPVVIKEPRSKFCRGAPACWEFLDEVWMREEEERQKLALVQLKKRIKKRILEERTKGQKEHDRIIKKAGPGWYQELSPKQKETVNSLRSCLVKDKLAKTITNTQDNMAELGLVLRPHPSRIKQALKKCSSDPIRFLLHLEDGIDSAIGIYSINERLLLSAVAHLTIESTLRELHVRIPSPPRKSSKKQIIPKPKPKPPKKRKYKSPYLEPFTFERTVIRPKRNFERKDCPKSPYFAYVRELKRQLQSEEREDTKDILEEIIKELALAQDHYKQLFTLDNNPKLLLPTIYVPPKDPGDEAEWVMLQSGTYYEIKPRYRQVLKDNICDRKQAVKSLKTSFHRYAIGGVVKTRDGPKFLISGPLQEPPPICECRRMVQGQEAIMDLLSLKNRFIIEGVYRNRMGLFFNISGKITDRTKQSRSSKTSESSKSSKSSGKKQSTSEGTSKGTSEGTSSKSSSESTSKSSKSSLSSTGPCVCAEEQEAEHEEIEEEEEQEYDENLDTCICGFTPDQQKYIRRKHAANKLIKQGKRYQVGGVTNTPLGPVYNIVAYEPPVSCICNDENPSEKHSAGICPCEVLLHKFETKHIDCKVLLANYLNMSEKKTEEYMKETEPLIYNKNLINAGIVNTPKGQVFQIGGCIPTPKPCTCYEREDEEESSTSTEESEESDESKSSGEKTSDESETSKKDVEEEECVCSEESSSDEEEPQPCCTCKQQTPTPAPNYCVCGKDESPTGSEFPTCPCNKELETFPGIPCTCGPRYICDCQPDFVEKQAVDTGEEEEPFSQFKRFFIMKKIPCDRKTQRKLLENALSSMADDNWPLAKLPECHKLPHFRLWIQWRCGKCWGPEDKRKFVARSVNFWGHTNRCDLPKIKRPRLPWTNSEVHLLTWSHATTFKNILYEHTAEFYRQLRQWHINAGREFFPSMFYYEFPTKGFLDCYFSYIPSKEENSFPVKIWKDFEFRDFSKRKSCL